MPHGASLLVILYFVAVLLFSMSYFVAWNMNPDAFIIHQEMNRRPVKLWRRLRSIGFRQQIESLSAHGSNDSIDAVFESYSKLVAEDTRLRKELETLTPLAEGAKAELSRVAHLHNHEVATNMSAIVEEEKQQHSAELERILSRLRTRLAENPSDVSKASTEADEALRAIREKPKSTVEEVMRRAATASKYREAVTSADAEYTRLSGAHLDKTEELSKNEYAQRTLLESWEAQRVKRLSYFDFLYFSLGVATSNTFGDVIPNAQTVRYLISAQLLISITLFGLFLNSVH